ncbi:unnamed protein product [Moneuplotes crassus]|uniref:histidine kinase n=1 Tax=Euplotes crassus TaxID=5936 RepID=A0AAD1U2R5_EUPCR|nr:unnamed protein product [Moneuplotes crassus]
MVLRNLFQCLKLGISKVVSGWKWAIIKGSRSDREVDEYINKDIEESIQKSYLKYIKMVCWLFIILLTVVVIFHYPDLSESNMSTKNQASLNSGVLILILLALIIALEFKPIYILYFVPILIWSGSYLCTLLTLKKDYYRLDEYHISSCCLSHMLIILVPHQWKSSSFVHAASLLYMLYNIWDTYGVTNSDMIAAILFSCLWFTISSYLLIIRTRSLYSEILRNKKLINEMKKVIQILPFGVVIWPAKADEKWFTNREFTSKYAKIRNDLKELEDIDISFVQNDKQNNISPKLSTFLKSQQTLLKNKESYCEQDIKIDCNLERGNMIVENQDNSLERTCSIKTLMVEWEGVESYMHCFIDNTDVIKLEEAKNNIKCQKIMFASASHEFRTPLNSIMNSIDILKASFRIIFGIVQPYISRLNPEQKQEVDLNLLTVEKFLKIGKNSSMLLLTLIEDVLNLSKMEAGTFTIKKELFGVKEILDEIYSIFNMQCEQRKLKLKLEVSEVVKALVINSDRARIKQVLMNLISNSLKFTFKGSITICCRVNQCSSSKFAEFIVRDTGVGIRNEDQEKLFQLFSMVSKSKSLNPNGTGIGLTVSKRYVETMGGKIHLKSVYKKGTDVIFTIPIDEKSKTRNRLPIPAHPSHNYSEEESSFFEEGHKMLVFSRDMSLCSRGKFIKARSSI